VLQCDYLAHNVAHNLLLSCVALQDSDGASAVDRLFGLKLHTKLKCEETGEEMQVRVWLQLQLRHKSTGQAVVQCCRCIGHSIAAAAAVSGLCADLCCAILEYLHRSSPLCSSTARPTTSACNIQLNMLEVHSHDALLT
jgi:hypothetical protein